MCVLIQKLEEINAAAKNNIDRILGDIDIIYAAERGDDISVSIWDIFQKCLPFCTLMIILGDTYLTRQIAVRCLYCTYIFT